MGAYGAIAYGAIATFRYIDTLKMCNSHIVLFSSRFAVIAITSILPFLCALVAGGWSMLCRGHQRLSRKAGLLTVAVRGAALCSGHPTPGAPGSHDSSRAWRSPPLALHYSGQSVSHIPR
jgi:hypothetical protein